MRAEEQTHELVHGQGIIRWQLARSPGTKLRIQISPGGEVRVRAPESASLEEIEGWVRAKSAWIHRHLLGLRAYLPLPRPRCGVSGESVYYLGRHYRLKVQAGTRAPARMQGGYLHVTAETPSDAAAVRGAVEAWYRRRAQEVFSRHLQACQQVAHRHGIPPARLTVRSMRTRWGSCSPTGRITLNLRLVETPVHCIEYVILHELCHLAEPNHSKRFYRLLGRCMPDWERRRRLLAEFSLA